MIDELGHMADVKLRLVTDLVALFVRERQGVTLEDMHGPTRGSPDVVIARHMWLYLSHVCLGGSITRTARVIDCDRRLVGYAIARIEARREETASFDRLMGLYEMCVARLIRSALLRLRLGLVADAGATPRPSDPVLGQTFGPQLHLRGGNCAAI